MLGQPAPSAPASAIPNPNSPKSASPQTRLRRSCTHNTVSRKAAKPRIRPVNLGSVRSGNADAHTPTGIMTAKSSSAPLKGVGGQGSPRRIQRSSHARTRPASARAVRCGRTGGKAERAQRRPVPPSPARSDGAHRRAGGASIPACLCRRLGRCLCDGRRRPGQGRGHRRRERREMLGYVGGVIKRDAVEFHPGVRRQPVAAFAHPDHQLTGDAGAPQEPPQHPGSKVDRFVKTRNRAWLR